MNAAIEAMTEPEAEIAVRVAAKIYRCEIRLAVDEELPIGWIHCPTECKFIAQTFGNDPTIWGPKGMPLAHFSRWTDALADFQYLRLKTNPETDVDL